MGRSVIFFRSPACRILKLMCRISSEMYIDVMSSIHIMIATGPEGKACVQCNSPISTP